MDTTPKKNGSDVEKRADMALQVGVAKSTGHKNDDGPDRGKKSDAGK